jgi:Ala-tRNA(Pro) deacylase
MIPKSIIDYLHGSGTPFRKRPHPRAVTAQELAASMHVTGYAVAKAVLVEAEARRYIAVLPAAEMLDDRRFARAVHAHTARLLTEDEFVGNFGDSEPGAEPPFGGLYGLPVVVDDAFSEEEIVVFRAGSHEEAIEMRFEDFLHLEHPITASIGRPFADHAARTA